MNAREKTYTMALATLLLIGLSSAWAATSYVAYKNIGASGIYDFANVSGVGSHSLAGLKKNMWFSKNLGAIFNVTGINASKIFVRVTLLNMPELVTDFRSLNINITLGNSTTPIVDYGVISLETGMASALLYAENIGSGNWLAVNATVYGHTSPKASHIVTLKFACAVEPATSIVA